MKKTQSVTFAEFKRFLEGLGYHAKKTKIAWAFKHPTEELLAFRLYRDNEAVDGHDLRSTRKYFDYRGILPEKDFDAFVERAARRHEGSAMIASDHELQVTMDRIVRFVQQAANLRKTERNLTNYRAAVSGFLAEIDRMQLEIREYLGVLPAQPIEVVR
jgi:hypothetical protein